MTSAQALKYAQDVIKNDPQALRPLILLLYGMRESRGDPEWEATISDVLGRLFVRTGQWEDSSLKEYISLAA